MTPPFAVFPALPLSVPALAAGPVCEAPPLDRGPVCASPEDSYLPPESTPFSAPPLLAATMTLPLVARTIAEGVEIALPPVGPREQRFVLGRAWGEGVIRVVEGWPIEEQAKVSKRHAELRIRADGSYELRDLGSLNGTMLYREDPRAGVCEEIRVNGQWVTLREGDVIRLATLHFEWHGEGDRPRLVPTSRVAGRARALAQAEASQPVVHERPLIERLREAMRGRQEVELFLAEAKEKHVGRIISIEGEGERAIVRFEGEDFRGDYTLSQILTIRDRHIDLTGRYVHPRIRPQFRDRSINVSGVDGSGKVVLLDFADPFLVRFLEVHMRPIRDELDAGTISQREAATRAWRIVRDYVPYDHGRLFSDLPNQMYRLGDFVDRGVCNERGMILQVSFQYIGIESRMEKGPYPGGRHAWTRAFVSDADGSRVTLVLDPQRHQVLEVGVDSEAGLYHDDSTPFAHERAMTVLMDNGGDFSNRAERQLAREGIEPAEILGRVRRLRSESLGIDYGPIRWEHIESIRRQQIHNRLWLSSVSPMGILYNRPYERLTEEGRLAEQRAALEFYGRLSLETRGLLWREEGRTPDGTLPDVFLNRYQGLRLALHEEGGWPFGRTDGLVEALSEGDLSAPRRPMPPPEPVAARDAPGLRWEELRREFPGIEVERRIPDELLGREATVADLIDHIGRRQARQAFSELAARYPDASPAELTDVFTSELGFRVQVRVQPSVARHEAPPPALIRTGPSARSASSVQASLRTGLDDIDRSRNLPYDRLREVLADSGVSLDPDFESDVRTVGDLVDRIGPRRARRIYSFVESSRGALVGEALEQAFLGELLAEAIERDHGPIEVSRRPELVRRFEQAILGRRTGREARGRVEGRETERPRDRDPLRRSRGTPRRGH